MFYSHDLLGRKTPLGAIWTLAHGRKLSKGKIISINLREICDEILQPGVPHSLRLQGILIGGLVLVFSKQQTYLLEDLQEMMRRVKAAGETVGATDVVKAEKGKGKAKGKKGANNQARLEAITLMDMEDLLAPAAYADDDILGLLAGGSLSDALASQGVMPADRTVGMQGGELAGDLFVMPSLGGGTTSEGGDTDAEGRPISKHSSRGTRTASGRQQHQQEEEVYGGVDMMQHDWLNPADEVFAELDADLDLLGGMDLPAPPPAATHSDRSRDQTSSQQQKQAMFDAAAAATPVGVGVDGAAVDGGVPYVFDDQMMLMEDEEQLEAPQQPEEVSEQQQEQPGGDQQQGHDQADAGQAADQMQVRRAKQRKRKAGSVMVDELDNLVIRSKVYREWSMDSSPLVNAELKSGRALQATTSPAAPLLGGQLLQDSFAGVNASAGLGFADFGVPLCHELAALFKGPEEAAAAERTAGGAKGQPQQPGSPEVNNSTGEGSLPGMLPHTTHKMPLDLHEVPGPADDMMMQGDELLIMPEEGLPHPDEQELMSNDEAHDQLGDLPFQGDIEVERLRAANTPGSSDGSLQHLLPGGGGGSSAAHRMRGAGRDSNATSAGGSSLLMGRSKLGGGSELDSSGLKRRLGSADLGTTDDLDIFFGTGNLADMLPDIEAAEFYDNQQQQQAEGPESEDLDNAALAAGRAGSVPGSDRELTTYSSSQFPLLEETEPDQPTQLPQDQAALSNTTRMALSIFQERLQRSGEQLAAEAGLNDAAGAPAAEPSVSFFGLIKEGRLSRNQAATLFYQVCVTTTAGFVSTSQEHPYGDIVIKQGSRVA